MASKSSSKRRRLERQARLVKTREPTAPVAPRGGRLRMAVTHPDGTRYEVRHMSDKDINVYLFTALSDKGSDGEVWIQLAKPGEFRGHGQGAFRLDSSVFSTLIDNFRANENGEIPIDFEHASEMPPQAGSIPFSGAPAQGWIRDLKVQDGNLMALVKWGELARDYIRKGEYKYISPAIRWKSKDRKTGAERGATLTSAGLTNQPFLDGMMPLAASDKNLIAGCRMASDAEASSLSTVARCYSSDEYMPAIRAALKLPELATASEMSEHIVRLREHLEAAGWDANGISHGVKLADYLLPLRELVKPSMGTTWEQVIDLVEDLIDAALDEHEIEWHGGSAVAESAEMSAKENIGETMDKNDSAAVSLLAAKETEISTLTLKVTGLEAEKSTLSARVTELEAKLGKIADAEIEKDVEVAFSTYASKFGLKAEHKPHMLSMRKGTPEAFAAMYPVVEPSQRHLLSNFTGNARNAESRETRVATDSPAQVQTMSARDLAMQIQRQRRCSLATAQNEALRIVNASKRG